MKTYNNNMKTVINNGISFNGLLFITFLVLKLTDVINWSWIWVTAPLWIPFSIGIFFFVVLTIIWILAKILQ